MSVGSPAEIIPFTRFLEYRQRLNRRAATQDTLVTPASADLGTPPEVTDTRALPVAYRRSVSAIVHPAMASDHIAIV